MGSTSQLQPVDPAFDLERTADHVPPIRSLSTDEPTVISQPGRAEGGGAVVPAPPRELSKLLAGEKLGHYELLDFAGGGGMGAVFRARDVTLNREVAIKVLSREQAADQETLKRFRNEAQSAARLDHQNIARVYYVGEDRGLNYIVFEFVEGLNVRQLVDRDGPLSLAKAVSYVTQVADALDHASARDVVHRDIKPSNIVITSQGKAKLVDMGLARLQGLQQNADLTASGVTLGTFDYISPEQARDPRTADVRSDIYSLGCTLYFMLTGRPPFPEGTVLQKLLQHNSDDPIDPREFNPDLPDAVTSLMRKMLAKDPARRYQTPNELIADLMHFAEQFGLRQGDVAPTSDWEAERRGEGSPMRHLTWIVPAAVLLAAFVAFEVWERRADSRWSDAWLKNHAEPNDAGDGKISGVGSGRKTKPNDAATGDGTASPPTNALSTNAATSPTEPTTTVASVEPTSPSPAVGKVPSPREGVLVVCQEAVGEGYFSSLRAACFAARNGDVIELCYDGPRSEKPLVLNNLKVTIRGGEGFRPVVRFDPGTVLIPNAPHAMMTIVGGRLDLVGVDVEFDVPSPQELPVDRWSLFELQRSEHLGFDRSTITVRNSTGEGRSYHSDVAVFGLRSPPGMAGAMMNDETAAVVAPVEIRLNDSIVRGEASLLRAADLQSVLLGWSNGLLAVADSALIVHGGTVMPRDSEVSLELHHVTTVVGEEWMRVANGFDAPFLPRLSIRCADGLLISASAKPLLEYEGVDARSDFLANFQWTADRAAYDGFADDAFWHIHSGTAGTQVLSYEAWLAHWGPEREIRTRLGSVRRRRELSSPVTFHRLTADDVRLDPTAAGNSAVGAAGDGGDLGLDAADLREPFDKEKSSEPTMPESS